jgi:hypothetical protein
MALYTLKDYSEVDGFEIRHSDDSGMFDVESSGYVTVNHLLNEITFRIQNGPIKEHGVNGCQVDTLIAAAMVIIYELNEKFGCEENVKAIEHLAAAYDYLKERKANREQRGVEGTSNK